MRLEALHLKESRWLEMESGRKMLVVGGSAGDFSRGAQTHVKLPAGGRQAHQPQKYKGQLSIPAGDWKYATILSNCRPFLEANRDVREFYQMNLEKLMEVEPDII